MSGILFDARAIRPGMTGIGNYARNILRALPVKHERIGVILNTGSPYAEDFPGCTVHFTGIHPDSHPLTEIFEQILVPRMCKKLGYTSLVAFGGPVPAFHPGLKVYPFVHDLAYLRIKGSHNFRYSLLLRLNLWVARHFATRILTVSEAERENIVAMLGLAPERVAVVHPADSKLENVASVPVGLPERPFFLATSLTNGRKNIATLLEAFNTFKAASRHDHMLVLTGHESMIHDALAQTPCPASINLGFVRDGELRFLYEHASALIYPSLDEGFGIPLLDAAGRGCPILCSDIPVFREVIGPLARYFDPRSAESIAQALAAHANEPEGARAPFRPERFSWEASATKLLALLEQDQRSGQAFSLTK